MALGFDIEIFEDSTAAELKHCIDTLAEEPYDEYNSLIICIMSHGDRGTISGTDEEEVLIEDIESRIDGIPTLVDKPKIFIYEACQGKIFPAQYPSNNSSSNLSPGNSAANNLLRERSGKLLQFDN